MIEFLDFISIFTTRMSLVYNCVFEYIDYLGTLLLLVRIKT